MLLRRVLLFATIASLFTAIVVGAYVTVANFGNACGSDIPKDWPTCLGGLFPPLQTGPVAEYTHRLFAALSTLFLVLTLITFWRSDEPSGVKRTVLVATVLLFAQVLLGGVVISQEEEPLLVAVHQGLAILTFGVAIVALVKSRQTGPTESVPTSY